MTTQTFGEKLRNGIENVKDSITSDTSGSHRQMNQTDYSQRQQGDLNSQPSQQFTQSVPSESWRDKPGTINDINAMNEDATGSVVEPKHTRVT